MKAFVVCYKNKTCTDIKQYDNAQMALDDAAGMNTVAGPGEMATVVYAADLADLQTDAAFCIGGTITDGSDGVTFDTEQE